MHAYLTEYLQIFWGEWGWEHFGDFDDAGRYLTLVVFSSREGHGAESIGIYLQGNLCRAGR